MPTVVGTADRALRTDQDRWLELRSLANARLVSGRGDRSDAVAVARLVRRALGDIGSGDWSDVGVRVLRQRSHGSGMLRASDWPIVVVVNEAEDVRRHRFTVAHELAHYLLRGSERLLAPAAVEPFCDVFASELLVPHSRLEALRGVDDDLPTAEELVNLANRLRVNLAPVILKLPDLAMVRPSFAFVALHEPDSGRLYVETSAGTGGMGGPFEKSTVAKFGAWRVDRPARRSSGVDRLETRFGFPMSIPPRLPNARPSGARSGSIAGTARWTSFSLKNGRVVVSATFTHVEHFEVSPTSGGGDDGHEG